MVGSVVTTSELPIRKVGISNIHQQLLARPEESRLQQICGRFGLPHSLSLSITPALQCIDKHGPRAEKAQVENLC